jgi:RNA polymerase sigma-70 factor (ECF subfamily)
MAEAMKLVMNPAEQASDAHLIWRVRSGEREVYGQLVLRYQDRLYNVCRRVCGSEEDARDVVQDAFLKAFQGIGGFREGSSFFTWLYRIAMNMALSQRRRARIRLAAPLDESHNGQMNRTADGRMRNTDLSDSVGTEKNEDHQRVADALSRLDEHQRAVVVLRDMDGLSYDEIGEILELTAGTVKSRLHRARQALRDLLAPQEPIGGVAS